jgi:hypothetical protein
VYNAIHDPARHDTNKCVAVIRSENIEKIRDKHVPAAKGAPPGRGARRPQDATAETARPRIFIVHFSTFLAFRPLKQKYFVLFSSAGLKEAGRNDEWASGLALSATLATQ